MKCPYCNSDLTFPYYDVKMPNILAACPEEMHQKVKTFPIRAELCTACGLGFNAARLDDEELKFIYDNYCYISPLHAIGTSKYEGMLSTLQKYCSKKDKLVEIGCSEGYLLLLLKENGYENLTGIEPGPQADSARRNGINVIKDYFTQKTFFRDTVNAFFLMHVYEHLENPFELLDIMQSQLSRRGKIILEVPNFTGYHHQHLYYFSAPFLARMSKDKNLKIVELFEDSEVLRVVFVKITNQDYPEITRNFDKDLVIERAHKMQKDFQDKIKQIEQLFRTSHTNKIYWWGAGSASTILLNQLDPDLLEQYKIAVIDSDPKKQGLLIPGTNLQVGGFTNIKGQVVENLVIASSFHNEIQETMKKYNISTKNTLVVF